MKNLICIAFAFIYRRYPTRFKAVNTSFLVAVRSDVLLWFNQGHIIPDSNNRKKERNSRKKIVGIF